jgi:hypothetical protein
MILKIQNQTFRFQKIPLTFHQRNIENIFYLLKSNKSLLETFKGKRYTKIGANYREHFKDHHKTGIADFLRILKTGSDDRYLTFLNKHGDGNFCHFSINEHLNDRGIYCFAVNDQIKYIGRCKDNFKKRINDGYGKIHPKNCFLDGQSTNCHLNSLINKHENVEFGILSMNNKSASEISDLEKMILANETFEWNVQTK